MHINLDTWGYPILRFIQETGMWVVTMNGHTFSLRVHELKSLQHFLDWPTNPESECSFDLTKRFIEPFNTPCFFASITLHWNGDENEMMGEIIDWVVEQHYLLRNWNLN